MNRDALVHDRESRWPAVVAVLAIGGVYLALPGSLVIGPRWLHPAMLIVMLTLTIVTHFHGNARWNQVFGHILAGGITFFMVGSLILLVRAVPTSKEAGLAMFRSAAALWITNVLVFAYWYWRLDGGGPHARLALGDRAPRAFLFPQMTLHDEPAAANWSPQFIDYLFVGFNTSTAFSPTDAAVLSRWAKILNMLQAIVSLTIIAVLAARAINIV